VRPAPTRSSFPPMIVLSVILALLVAVVATDSSHER
jgi:hypothetical protein